MNITLNKHLNWFPLFTFIVMFLSGCGGSSSSFYDDGDETVDPTVPVASTLIISSSQNTVQSDGTDSATISVLALDSSNAVVDGALVSFTATSGGLSAAAAVTDSSGTATVTVSAGIADPTNQTITVTASSTGATSASVPVAVIGSTVTITPTSSNLVLGGVDTTTITVEAADSSGTGVYNEAVTLSIDTTASTGTANLSSLSGTTDLAGEYDVTLTGISAGTVRVVATALNTSTFYDFNVESVAGSLLITSHSDGGTVSINTQEAIAVDVPAGITDLTLVSSLGNWTSSGTGVLELTGLSAGTVTEDISSSSVGTTTIHVADSNDSTVNDSVRLVFVDETVDETSSISLQASPTTIAPSVSGSENSSTIEAMVVNASSEPIANARVTFSISNTTGSGEYVDPPVAYTDEFGKATTSVFSGSQSTDASGLTITGDLDETLTGGPVNDSVAIIVNGTVGSISIGLSTTLSAIQSNTAYSLPVSLQVADSGGNPVANTEINLSIWPEKYGLGFWVCEPEPGLFRYSEIANEDVDKDLVADAGEDISGDGQLTPPNTAGGSVPSSVTTDANGFASFEMQYHKDYAGFVFSALSATGLVQGTETKSVRRFWLGATDSDISSCVLGESPFNAAWPLLVALPDVNPVPVSTSTDVTVTLTNQASTPLAGEDIEATIISTGTDGGVAPSIVTSPQVTDVNGEVTFTYTAGDQAGSDWLQFTYTTALGHDISTFVEMVAE